MRPTVFFTNGQLNSLGQIIIGGPLVGVVAQQVSVSWGLACTALLLLPSLFLLPITERVKKNKHRN